MRLRKALFPLLVLFALLTSQISPAYIVFGILAAAWLLEMRRSRRPASVRLEGDVSAALQRHRLGISTQLPAALSALLALWQGAETSAAQASLQ